MKNINKDLIIVKKKTNPPPPPIVKNVGFGGLPFIFICNRVAALLNMKRLKDVIRLKDFSSERN